MNDFYIARLGYLLPVALIALGVSYIITCSKIGFWLRAFWFVVFGYIPLVRKFTTLVFCPACTALWIGLVTAFLADAEWWVAVQCALVSCGVAAVANGVAGLAAEDEGDIRHMWQKIGKHLRG